MIYTPQKLLRHDYEYIIEISLFNKCIFNNIKELRIGIINYSTKIII